MAQHQISLSIALKRAILACEFIGESFRSSDNPSVTGEWFGAATTLKEHHPRIVRAAAEKRRRQARKSGQK